MCPRRWAIFYQANSGYRLDGLKIKFDLMVSSRSVSSCKIVKTISIKRSITSIKTEETFSNQGQILSNLLRSITSSSSRPAPLTHDFYFDSGTLSWSCNPNVEPMLPPVLPVPKASIPFPSEEMMKAQGKS
ncbi:hypothetical protein Tco_1303901 [Tanacetum coccineum]